MTQEEQAQKPQKWIETPGQEPGSLPIPERKSLSVDKIEISGQQYTVNKARIQAYKLESLKQQENKS